MNIRNPMLAALEGERYEAQVPDTLDLADRMALAVNALTNVYDEKEKHALYFFVGLSCRPPVLWPKHGVEAFHGIPPKFIEGSVLCRLGSGTDLNIETDGAVLQDQLIDLTGEDGLSYVPADAMMLLDDASERPYTDVWGEGRWLIALSMLAQVDDDPRWREIGQRKIDRMLSLTTEKDGYRYLWSTRYRPGDTPNGAPEPDLWPCVYSTGALGHGSALFYRVTGYKPALELARGLARWVLHRVFHNEDGHWDFFHFHHSLYSLIAVLEYALAARDKELLSRVDACYRYAREMGDSLIGYFPEVMPGWPRPEPRTTEICEVADMLVIALKLTQAGTGDYWDDVDRWTRNIFAEGQMTTADFVERIPEEWLNQRPELPYIDDRDIARRSIGSFWGWMRPNDGLCVSTTENGEKNVSLYSIMHCCTGNGARTLYYVWDGIVINSGDRTCVNLLLNRVSPWLDVESYLPVEGKVVLRSKMAQQVTVRMPEWVDLARVKVSTESGEVKAKRRGRELNLGQVQAGETVTLTFPVPEKALFRNIFSQPYKLTMRGSNVVGIEPRGEACPLFEDQPKGMLVTKSRFIPSKRVVW